MDITETGSSLRANKLRIVDTLMESYPQFVSSKPAYSDPWKRDKMKRLALLVNGALEARYKVGLKLNLPDHKLEAMLHALPSLRRPTISQLAGGGWVAVRSLFTNPSSVKSFPNSRPSARRVSSSTLLTKLSTDPVPDSQTNQRPNQSTWVRSEAS